MDRSTASANGNTGQHIFALANDARSQNVNSPHKYGNNKTEATLEDIYVSMASRSRTH